MPRVPPPPPPTRRGRAVVDDEAELPPSRRGRETTTPPKKVNGWAAVSKAKEEKEERDNSIRDFFLLEDEEAIVQILDDEPYVCNMHQIKSGGKFKKEVCQKENQRTCLMCNDGIKDTFGAMFRVLDYRGNWDSTKRKFKYDAKIEKAWWVGQGLAVQIQSFQEKRGVPLTQMVLLIERSGGGKTTKYNISYAFDEKENKMKPVKYKPESKVEEITKPKTDEQLERMGFESNDD
jgi:hypothetical protein